MQQVYFNTALGGFTAILDTYKIYLLHPTRTKNSLDKHYPSLEEQILKVSNFIENKTQSLDLISEQRGSEFQHKVWDEVCRIPFGTTVSYKQIAINLGVPNHARAVARACAQNNLAIIVPCHRVIRSDGKISGYSWGQNLKEKILDREK